VPAQPAVSPARAASLPSTVTLLEPEVTVPEVQGLELSSARAASGTEQSATTASA
jgi:hypothetical protein